MQMSTLAWATNCSGQPRRPTVRIVDGSNTRICSRLILNALTNANPPGDRRIIGVRLWAAVQENLVKHPVVESDWRCRRVTSVLKAKGRFTVSGWWRPELRERSGFYWIKFEFVRMSPEFIGQRIIIVALHTVEFDAIVTAIDICLRAWNCLAMSAVMHFAVRLMRIACCGAAFARTGTDDTAGSEYQDDRLKYEPAHCQLRHPYPGSVHFRAAKSCLLAPGVSSLAGAAAADR